MEKILAGLAACDDTVRSSCSSYTVADLVIPFPMRGRRAQAAPPDAVYDAITPSLLAVRNGALWVRAGNAARARHWRMATLVWSFL